MEDSSISVESEPDDDDPWDARDGDKSDKDEPSENSTSALLLKKTHSLAL